MSAAPTILVVDDEALFAKAVCKRLQRAGFTCDSATTLAQAQVKLRQNQPHLIILDMRLPDGSGLDFLGALREGGQAHTAVVGLTAYGELDDAVAAMKLGALDYLKKPIDLDELVLTVQRVFERLQVDQQLAHSRQREHHAQAPAELLGDSAALRQARAQLQQIAALCSKTDGVPPTVLILGETGTGKDLAARYLHRHSRRQAKPFVQVDCAALPKELIESELFGHEKGAFTHAHIARTGLIEAAEDGTVLLDEIGEVPLELQAKLLAVLERHTLRRVGSSQERAVAAWFMAATNRDLETLVKAGGFRADLYFRLRILTLELPPLRARGDDVVLLAHHFAAQAARRYGLALTPELTPDALAALRAYAWPGNVRELVNLIERAVILSAGSPLSAAALQLKPAVTAAVEPGSATDLTLEEAEANLLRQALSRCGGNVSQAARQLGITRMTLRYRMQKYGIER